MDHLTDTSAGKFPVVPTIGITYDMSDDFKFASDDPWDWDAEFEVSMAMGDITNAIEDLGFPTVVIGSAARLLDGFSEYRRKVHMVFNIADGKLGRAIEGNYIQNTQYFCLFLAFSQSLPCVALA